MNRSVSRRDLLRLAAVGYVGGLSSLSFPGRSSAQLSPGSTKSEKDRDKLFDLIRIEWGLIEHPEHEVGDQPRVGDQPLVGDQPVVRVEPMVAEEPRVGDELGDQVEDAAATADSLTARLRSSLKKIELRSYTRDQRVDMKHVVLRTEAEIRGVIDSFAGGRLERSQAREAIRAAFAGVLVEIEAYPRAGER